LPEPLTDGETVGVDRTDKRKRDHEQDELDASLVPAFDALHRLVEGGLERFAKRLCLRGGLSHPIGFPECVGEQPLDRRVGFVALDKRFSSILERFELAFHLVNVLEQRERKHPRRDVRGLLVTETGDEAEEALRLRERLDPPRVVEAALRSLFIAEKLLDPL